MRNVNEADVDDDKVPEPHTDAEVREGFRMLYRAIAANFDSCPFTSDARKQLRAGLLAASNATNFPLVCN